METNYIMGHIGATEPDAGHTMLPSAVCSWVPLGVRFRV